MRQYLCGRCLSDTASLTADMCASCVSVLDSFKEGDPVRWTHGKGWSNGTFVRRLKPRLFEVRNQRGTLFIRKHIYFASER